MKIYSLCHILEDISQVCGAILFCTFCFMIDTAKNCYWFIQILKSYAQQLTTSHSKKGQLA